MDQTGGRSRYRLLEPVRQYAHEQLVMRGELDATRRRHAKFFLDFGEAQERATNVGGPERTAATAALLQEYPNFRLALGWCIEAEEGQLGLRLACTVQFSLWEARGNRSEGLAWLERLLALPDAQAPTPARAMCVLMAGFLADQLGRVDHADTFFEAGLALARTIDDPRVQFHSLFFSSLHASDCGDLDAATRYLHEALAVARATDDRVEQAYGLFQLSMISFLRCNYAHAQEFGEDQRRIAHAAGEERADLLTS